MTLARALSLALSPWAGLSGQAQATARLTGVPLQDSRLGAAAQTVRAAGGRDGVGYGGGHDAGGGTAFGPVSAPTSAPLARPGGEHLTGLRIRP